MGGLSLLNFQRLSAEKKVSRVLRCYKCKTEKATDQFMPSEQRKMGYKRCRLCLNRYLQVISKLPRAARRRNYYEKNPEQRARDRRRDAITSKYNVRVSWIEDLLKHQKGRCAICKSKQSKGFKSLCVDHSHSSGEVRGMLCDRCNSGIGQFRDDPALLASAILYLVRPPASLAGPVRRPQNRRAT